LFGRRVKRFDGTYVFCTELGLNPMNDIDIAQAAEIKPIGEIADKLGIPNDALMPYGHTKAKVNLDYIR